MGVTSQHTHVSVGQDYTHRGLSSRVHVLVTEQLGGTVLNIYSGLEHPCGIFYMFTKTLEITTTLES